MKIRFKNHSLIIFFILFIFYSPLASQQLSFLRVEDQKIVNEKNEEVLLGGFNLGNWLIDPGMIKLNDIKGIEPGKDIFDFFVKRFEEQKAMKIYSTYVENYIIEQDIKYLSELGVNFVRVPFDYRALLDEQYTKNNLYYLDKLIKWCKKYKIYVLIAMQSAPGEKSTNKKRLGKRLKNELWTKEENIKLTIQMWYNIAIKYKNESTVAGYDILNEASGSPDYKTLVQVYNKIYHAIRNNDKKHIIFMQDALKGIYRLPIASNVGWSNVVYSFHLYPSWGGTASRNKIKALYQVQFPSLKAYADYNDMPFHAGKFNISKGRVDLLKKFMHVFTEYGWPWNIWSYKCIDNSNDGSLCLVGRTEKWSAPDLNKMNFEEAKNFFKKFNTASLKKNSAFESMIRAYFKKIKKFKRPQYVYPDKLILVPQNGYFLRAKANKGIRIEWNKKNTHFGSWNRADSVLWLFNIKKRGVYKIVLDHITAAKNARLSLIVDHYRYKDMAIPRNSGGRKGYVKKTAGYIRLEKGDHALKIIGKTPDTKIMNLRSVEITYKGQDIKQTGEATLLSPKFNEEIILTPHLVSGINRKKSLCVEWQNNPPNLGYMSGGESFGWKINSPIESDYELCFHFSTPQRGVKFKIYVNGKIFKTVKAIRTGDWYNYKLNKAGKIHLRKGKNTIRFEVLSKYNEKTGNFRDVRMKKQ